jgi:hypothetical protein
MKIWNIILRARPLISLSVSAAFLSIIILCVTILNGAQKDNTNVLPKQPNANAGQSKAVSSESTLENIDSTRKAAEAGDAAAQSNLGGYYYRGEGLEKDYETAVEWFKKAAAKGDITGIYNLGLCYYTANGVPMDKDMATSLFRKAAEAGLDLAQYNLGACLEAQGLVTEAQEWRVKAAQQGMLEAQLTAAMKFELPPSGSSDIKQAEYWYRKAAEQGSAEAQFKLGSICARRMPRSTKNEIEAFGWYLSSGKQGHCGGMLEAARSYDGGIGVAKNKVEAAAYFAVIFRWDPNGRTWQGQVASAWINENTPQMTDKDLQKSLKRAAEITAAISTDRKR